MTPELLTAIAAIVSASTALVAVLIGPLIASRAQHRESVAVMREAWIQDLRQTLADLVSAAETAASALVQAREVNPDFKKQYDCLVRLEGKAKMMLNPKEPCHQALQVQLEKIVDLANDREVKAGGKMSQMRELTQSLIPASQAVFKEAWDRVK